MLGPSLRMKRKIGVPPPPLRPPPSTPPPPPPPPPHTHTHTLGLELACYCDKPIIFLTDTYLPYSILAQSRMSARGAACAIFLNFGMEWHGFEPESGL